MSETFMAWGLAVLVLVVVAVLLGVFTIKRGPLGILTSIHRSERDEVTRVSA